jgi:hypothetical protein
MTIEKGPSVDIILKNLTLANHDGELKGIVTIAVTGDDLKIEVELSYGDGQAYAINTAIDLLKSAVLERIRNAGALPWRDRE